MKDTTEQCVLFEELHDRAVHVQFDQPDSSVDGGALLLKVRVGGQVSFSMYKVCILKN